MLYDSSSSDDDGPSLRKRRARWAALLAPNRRDARADGRRRRKEELPGSRQGRQDHSHPRGDARRFRKDTTRSTWWDIIDHPEVYDERSPTGLKFRLKFRMPRKLVDALVTAAGAAHPEWVPQPGRRGPRPSPLILKVCAALHQLAKGCDCETLEDVTLMGKSTLQSFIPKFLH